MMEITESLLNEAFALFRQGKLPQAELHCFRVLEDGPETQAAWRLLGFIGLRQGVPSIAATRLKRAVELDRNCLDSRLALAEAYRHLGEFTKCQHLCEETRPLHPQTPAIDNELGLLRLAMNDAKGAEAEFQAALAMAQDFVPALTNLADLFRSQGRMTEAISVYRQAAELAPSPSLLNNLGGLLAEQRHYEEASQCFHRIVKQWPGFTDATHNLGLLYHELGEVEEACHWLRETVRRNPNAAQAYSTLATYYPERLEEQDLRAIDGLLSKRDLPPEARALLLFSRGRWLDARKEFDRAARDVKAAHAIKLKVLAEQQRTYSSAAHEAHVTALIRAFDRPYFERITGWGLPSEQPVFVIGMQRSGTSLIEQILASHPEVHGAGEVRLVPNGFAKLPTLLRNPLPPTECVSVMERQHLAQAADHHLDALRQLNPAALHIVDKLPENYLYVGWIRSLFPNARIIHCCRDPRDIAVSCWLTRFQSDHWTHDPKDLLQRIVQYRRVMRHWNEIGASMLEICYEDLVADPEPCVRKLLEGIGLAWHPGCLEFHKSKRPVRTASASQIRRPIYSDSVARWKHYEQQLPDLIRELERLPN